MKKICPALFILFISFSCFSQSFTEVARLSALQDGNCVFGDYDNDGDLDMLMTGNDGVSSNTWILQNTGYLEYVEVETGLPNLDQSHASWGDYDNDGDLDILLIGLYNFESNDYGRSRVFRNEGNDVFTDIDAGLTGVWNGSCEWGDYDRDGDLDILITGYSETEGRLTKVYRNEGDGSFTDTEAGLPGVDHSQASWADYDNDNDLDILLIGHNGTAPYTRILKNDRNDSYTNIDPGFTPVYNGAAAWGDYDKDGRPDLVITGDDGSAPVAKIYHNDGHSYFTDINAGLMGVYESAVLWQDLDSDGSPDLVVTGNKGGAASSSIYHNDGNDVFSDINAGLYPTFRGSISCGDINQDNRLDLMISGNFGTAARIWIYVNNIFSPVSTGIQPVYNASGSWGDYDNDGDLDVLVCGHNGAERTSEIYRNDGMGTFNRIYAGLPGIEYGASEWGDYDNDGDLDILLSGRSISGETTRLYRNDGSNNFTELSAGLKNLSGSRAAWGDYNNDGYLDFILTGRSGSPDYAASSVLYKNNGDGSFSEQAETGLESIYEGDVEWGDYDSDGDLDLLISGQDASANKRTVIYRNDGDNTFTDIDAGLEGMYYTSAAWGDYDADGDLDILVNGYPSAGYRLTLIYRNDGFDVFTNINAGLDAVRQGSAEWGDYDGDGDLDIIISGNGTSGLITKIYANQGYNTFTDINTTLTGIWKGSSSWVDYDNDGDLDIFILGSSGGSFPDYAAVAELRENIFGVRNSIPTSPSNLKSQPSGNACAFTWDRSFDKETPQDGLSYNIYIGKTKNDVLAKSPMSDTETGYRNLVQSNSLLQANSWRISGLETGRYYWSVQGVDHNFAGSKFGDIDSFDIDFTSSIAPITEQHIFPDADGTAITVTESLIPDSRQWKYGLKSGGPYEYNISGETGATLNPKGSSFPGGGTYYVVCSSRKDAQNIISNEVKINVSQFDTASVSLEGLSQGSVSFGDYDMDGDLDILQCGYSQSTGRTTKIYRNDGSDVYTNITTGIIGIIGNLEWGDFDNDGDLDIFLMGSSTSGTVIRLYRNDGNNIFTDMQLGFPVISGSFSLGDYDTDGDLDIFIAGRNETNGNSVAIIWRNEKNGSFTELSKSIEGIKYGDYAWGDYDNDDDLDLLVTGEEASAYHSRIYRNDGNDTFADIQAGLTGVKNSHVSWGDYDSDGDLDIYLSGYSSSGSIAKVYRNNGNNSFTDIEAVLNTVDGNTISWSSALWGDFDNDSDLDLLFAGSYYSGQAIQVTRIYTNNNGQFIESKNLLGDISGEGASTGDYDNDGDLDIILAGYENSNRVCYIYPNRDDGNTPPSTPQNLTSIQDGSSVILSWDPSSDNETVQEGLSYNIYISDSPMGAMSMSPMSDRSTGYRMITLPGNAGTGSSCRLDLNAFGTGTNYWSVQALDGICATSAFASESMITDIAPSADFLLVDSIIYRDTVTVTYTGNATAAASYTWNFQDADYISGSGQGPYRVHWHKQGTFQVSLEVTENGISSGTRNASIYVSGRQITKTVTALPPLYACTVALGDYDNDNDMDVALAGYNNDGDIVSHIYRNDGFEVFTDINAGLTGIWFGELEWGDYDNDNDLDLIIVGDDGDAAISYIYRNDGFDVFTNINAGLEDVAYGAASWGDFDNDGDLDLVLAGIEVDNWYYVTKLYENKGNDVFEEVFANLPPAYDGSLDWGDYDNDDDLDLLVTGETDGRDCMTKIFRNDGRGVFTEQSDISLAGVYEGDAAWGDYDADGDLDIAVNGYADYGKVTLVYRNDGNNTFTELSELMLRGVDVSTISWGDIDNDGDLDLITSGYDDNRDRIAIMYQNDGNDQFTPIETGIEGVYYGSIAWGDYDMDQDLDILVSGVGESGYQSTLYRNDIVEPNSKPEAPTGLQTTVGNKVLLQWNKSSDDKTPPDGLSYNVFLRSEAKGLSGHPMADTLLGVRSISAPGNAGLNTSFEIDPGGLGIGMNYWTVQSIDNCYTGSGLPGWESFLIKPTSNFELSQVLNSKNDTITVSYTGNGSASSSYTWDFDGASYISGSGQGPYQVNWDVPGIYTISLTVSEDGYTSDPTNIQVEVISQTFAEISTGIIPLESGSLAWGDYDQDGDLDLHMSGSSATGQQSLIYRNDGNDVFTDIDAGLMAMTLSASAWGDYDNDGDLDLLVTGRAGSVKTSLIYKNKGNGVFTDIQAELTGTENGCADWGDVDGDGDLDILIAGYGSTCKIYLNEGKDIFSELALEDERIRNPSLDWGDYDNDGDLDILVAGYSLSTDDDETARIYRNDGDHVFLEQTGISLVGVSPASASWGDYDEDGDLDILLYGEDEDWNLRMLVYRNEGSNTFNEPREIYLPGVYAGKADWVDFDNDGDLDIFVTYEDNDFAYTRIYRNEGDHTFSNTNAKLEGLFYSAFAWGDYDNDGDQDLYMSGRDAERNKVSILCKNEGNVFNTVPTAPGGLISSVNGRLLNFGWNASTDAESPQNCITYNFYLSSSDTIFGVSPMADTETGFRLIPDRGNRQYSTSVSMDYSDMPAGSIDWSVQAIDQAGAGSPFGEKMSLIIPPTSDFEMDALIDRCDTASIIYTGNATPSATYNWDFDGGEIISGSGMGPYKVMWHEQGIPNVSLHVVAGGVYSDTSFHVIQINGLCFSEIETGITGMNHGDVRWGDFDNDEDLDVLLTGKDVTTSGSMIYRNDGNNIFTKTDESSINSVNSTASWGDYDNDGDLDYIIANKSTIYQNNGAGIFNSFSLEAKSLYLASADWGDYDHDGDLDILLAGNQNNTLYTRIYRNEGNSVFTSVDPGIAGIKSGDVAWGDYDNDGDLDCVISGIGESSCIASIYRNDGNNVFTDIGAGLEGVRFSALDWGDYDMDGDIDLLFAGQNEAGESISRIYRNEGFDIFSMVNDKLEGASYGDAAFGDYDNDGDLDILIAGMNNSYLESFNIYNNNGSGSFDLLFSRIPGIKNCSFSLGDYDNDTDLDIIVSGDDGDSLVTRIYRNEIFTVNEAPVTPAGLSSSVEGSYLKLSWNKSTDAETSSGSLSYNIYVRSKNSGELITGPMSNTETGYRSLPEHGNAGMDTTISIDISMWPTGSYYWSVQAIDNSFKASAFADADTILDIPPTSDFVFEEVSKCSYSNIVYTGNASAGAVYTWDFDGGHVTGSGQGPYQVVWIHPGVYHISLQVSENGSTSDITTQSITVTDQCFTDLTATLPGHDYGRANWGDFDNDGDLDVVVSGRDGYAYYCKILRYDGLNIFSDINADLNSSFNSAAAWGDYDNDGDLDLIVPSSISRIYRNDGAGVFTNIEADIPAGYVGSADWGDYDQDGDLDVFLTGYTSDYPGSVIARNDGNDHFTMVSTGIAGIRYSAADWGDFDGDGDLDLAITGRDADLNYTSKIYRNDGMSVQGETAFTDINADLIPMYDGSLGWADYDADGDPDLMITGRYLDINVSSSGFIYRNDGEEGFHRIATSLPGALHASWGDFDNDGFMDIVSSGTDLLGNKAGKLYHNKGNDLFVCVKDHLPAIEGTVHWGDLENDGDLDILFHGDVGSDIQTLIYRNNGSIFNEVPLAPGGLSAEGIAEEITFSWDKTSDNATPGEGLSYNLRVGTTAGGCEIRSPMADPATGTRRIVSMGNAGQDTSLTLRNLPGDNIYWSVQAIDNSYGGSPFAGEHVFFSNPVFSLIDTEIPAVKYGNARWGDYDNDNDLDIVLCGMNSRNERLTIIYRNEGDSSFTDIGAVLEPVRYGAMDWGDYDMDGDLDLIYCGENADYRNITKIFRNEGGDIFTDINAGIEGLYGNVSWGDHDNDGDLDLLICGTNHLGNHILTIYINNGEGQFSEIVPMLGQKYGTAGWADYDNDGDLDILFVGREDNADLLTVIYRNDGNNQFSTHIIEEFGQLTNAMFDWGDYDADGDLDLCLAGQEGSSRVSRIFRNDGGEQFADIKANLQGVSLGSANWGDYDNDGDLDLLIPGSGGSVVYRNEGFDTFIQLDQFIPSSSYSQWGDHDNDGDLDILSAGNSSTSSMRIYNNNGHWSNDPPEVIENLRSEMEGFGIRLQWDPGQDKQGSEKGLSYNLWIGSAPYVGDIMTPMSDLSSGHRMIPAMGNAHLNTSYLLDSLAEGKYYWAVQAIDQSFAGGEWSALDSFEVTVVRAHFIADTVCFGSETHFSDRSLIAGSEISAWEWDFGDGSISDLQHPVHTFGSAGTYQVSLKAYAAQYSHSKTIEVIVKEVPLADFTADPVCIGSETSFINTTGTENVSIASWHWDLGDGNTSTLREPENHLYSSGEYTVSLIAGADNGCSSRIEKNVQVVDYPSSNISISGSPNFCEGDHVELRVPHDETYLYQWMVDGVSINDANLDLYYADFSGSYTVSVTNPLGNCSSTSATAVDITVSRPPDMPVIEYENYSPGDCMDEEPVTLSVYDLSGMNYQWKRNGTSISDANSSSYSGYLSEADYSVEVEQHGCYVESEQLTIDYGDMLPKPGIIAKGPVVWYLACSNDSASAYKWYYEGQLIEGATDHIYVAGQKMGSYKVGVSANGECYTFSDPLQIPLGTGLDEDPFKETKIYPNPTSGLIIVELDHPLVGELMIEVISVSGKVLYNDCLLKEQMHFITEIDLSAQPAAVYTVRMRMGEWRGVKTVSVKR